MAVKLDIEPGGEWLLPSARTRLKVLRRWADTAGIHTAIKWIAVTDGSTIFLRTTRFPHDTQDLIRIRVVVEAGGFIATMFVRKLSPSTTKTYVAGRQPPFLPFNKTVWEPLGIVSSYTAGKPVVEGTTTRTPHSNSTVYLENKVNTAFGASGASYIALGVFTHSYTVGDVAQAALLQLGSDGGLYKLVGGVRTALAASGSAPGLETYTVASNGRTLLAYNTSGDASRAAIDMALGTPVTWTAIVDDPYGEQRTTETRHGGLVGTNNTYYAETVVEVEASYPLSRGVASDGLDKTIWVDVSYSTRDLRTTDSTGFSYTGPGSQVIGIATGVVSADYLQTATIRLPNGETKQFVLIEKSLGANADITTIYNGSATSFTGSGGWTQDRFEATGSLSIIYADPVIPFVLYEYTKTDSQMYSPLTIISGFYGFGSLAVEFSKVVTTSREVGIFMAGQTVVLESTVVVEDLSSPTSNPVSEPGFVDQVFPTNWQALVGSEFFSETTIAITDDSIFPIPAAARKAYQQGQDGAASGSNYACTAKSTTDWLVGVTWSLDFPPTMEQWSFRLWRGRTPTAENPLRFAEVSVAYLTYVSESFPIIGGPDPAVIAQAQAFIALINGILADPVQLQNFANQAFGGDVAAATAYLNGLKNTYQAILDAELAKPPGTPDPDSALLLSNPELFEIRASNLTYA